MISPICKCRPDALVAHRQQGKHDDWAALAMPKTHQGKPVW
ncbi:MAG: hypothetical protein R2806_04815 [Saprospiraceae bacterium]